MYGLWLSAKRDVSSADMASCSDIHFHADTCEDDAITGYEVIALKASEN